MPRVTRTCARRLLPGLPAAVLLLAAGCATYVASNLDLRSQLAASDWQAALARVDKRPGGRDHLLELLQRGHVLHYAGRFEDGLALCFESAPLAESLDGRDAHVECLGNLRIAPTGIRLQEGVCPANPPRPMPSRVHQTLDRFGPHRGPIAGPDGRLVCRCELGSEFGDRECKQWQNTCSV